MFNDDYSEDDDKGMGKDDIMKMHQEQVENAFFDAKNSGKDISIFLYMPIEFLSAKVRKELDSYLMDIAYDTYFIDNNPAFYDDTNLSITPVTDEAKLRTLEDMLKYYLEKEEYEKCVNIRDEIQKIKNPIENGEKSQSITNER